jgi:hypothetical protein
MATKRGQAKDPRAPVIDLDDPKQLQSLAVKVRDFAQGRAKVYRWWLRPAGALARGTTLDDIVATAVASLFGATDRGAWDPEAQPDPFEYLKSVVNSELWNLAVSTDNRSLDRLPDDHDVTADDTPLFDLLRAEEAADLKKHRDQFYSLLIDAISSDEDLLKLHDLIVNDGIDKPQQLAPQLKMSVAEVNNLKKRFMSACKKAGAAMDAAEETYD